MPDVKALSLSSTTGWPGVIFVLWFVALYALVCVCVCTKCVWCYKSFNLSLNSKTCLNIYEVMHSISVG